MGGTVDAGASDVEPESRSNDARTPAVRAERFASLGPSVEGRVGFMMSDVLPSLEPAWIDSVDRRAVFLPGTLCERACG